jgi:hypothetical protein
MAVEPVEVVLGARIHSRMRVIASPTDDAPFVKAVDDALARLDASPMPSRERVVRLLEQLLPTYPDVAIRQQDGLASFEADPNTWYVYRHGNQRP